jgi:hypothetical protein
MSSGGAKILRQLRAQGARVEQSRGSNHIKIYDPTGRSLIAILPRKGGAEIGHAEKGRLQCLNKLISSASGFRLDPEYHTNLKRRRWVDPLANSTNSSRSTTPRLGRAAVLAMRSAYCQETVL